MAKSLFTNDQLVKHWKAAATSDPKGTRKDVVTALMTEIGMDPTDHTQYRRMYNNVTQRVTHLNARAEELHKPIVFVELRGGPRGSRIDDSEIDRLANVIASQEEVTA